MSRYLPVVLLATACAEKATHPFPEGFAWGTATAGFQVEMGCPTWSDDDCLDRGSDWYQWVTDDAITADPDLFVTGEDVRNGPGMWETFERDVRRMKKDDMGGFRMSLEWSRLFPDSALAATSVDDLEALADPDAVARYHEWFDALDAAGIEPLVTLNHYTLPTWIHDGVGCHTNLDACLARGWVDREPIVPAIALYAGFCAREFGGEVDQWATLNEPFATTLSGYLQPGEDRSAPPGVVDIDATIATIRHQIEGSAAMYDAVHAEDTEDADGDGVEASVGIVMNMVAMVPLDPEDEDDVASVEHMDWLYHRQFLDGLTEGSVDADLDGDFDTTDPALAGRLDWIGINYYNRVPVNGLGVSFFPQIPTLDFLPEVSWDPYPEGIAEVVAKAVPYGLPIVITENGTIHVDESDAILEAHLLALHGAIEEGADVRGYYYWSYVDNYEWNHGMSWKLGLYALDLETKERTARPALEAYRRYARANGVITD